MYFFFHLFAILITSNNSIVIAGDVNIHTETENEHVNTPTHKSGHILDIVAIPIDNPVVTNVEANEYDLSRHFWNGFTVISNPEIRRYQFVEWLGWIQYIPTKTTKLQRCNV